MKHHYCSGSCHGMPLEVEVEQGKSVCDTKGCTMEGQEFTECECEDPKIHSAEHHDEPGHQKHN